MRLLALDICSALMEYSIEDVLELDAVEYVMLIREIHSFLISNMRLLALDIYFASLEYSIERRTRIGRRRVRGAYFFHRVRCGVYWIKYLLCLLGMQEYWKCAKYNSITAQ